MTTVKRNVEKKRKQIEAVVSPLEEKWKSLATNRVTSKIETV